MNSIALDSNSRRPASRISLKNYGVTHYYDSATSNDERDYGYFGGSVHEDLAFTGAARSITISRLRREIRNNPYLAGLVSKFPEAVGLSNMRSRTTDNAFNDIKERLWRRWSKSVTISGDSLRSLERIIWAEMLLAGELFIVLLKNGKVQVVPSEFCGSPIKEGLEREGNGILYSANGRPRAYRFGSLNAQGTIDFSDGKSTIINARDVIHIYDKDRVLMGRGLPWLLPSLQTARDLYEITRAKTKQIKDVNSIFGWIQRTAETSGLSGLSEDLDDDGKPEVEDGDSPADKLNTKKRRIEISPGTILELEDGEKLEFLKGEYNASDYKELIMLMLHAISSPVGLPVELWFSGLGDVNYSGFKGLGVQWDSRRQYLIQFIEDKFLNRLQFWRMSKASNEGDLPEHPEGQAELVDWAFRSTAVLDEEKVTNANLKRLKSGEECHADIWERKGFYPDEVLKRRRNVYIKALEAADPSAEIDPESVRVPLSFLFMNEIPKAEASPAQDAS
ncbi:MAG: phage portal protein [Verrucomicrobiota bacterium]